MFQTGPQLNFTSNGDAVVGDVGDPLLFNTTLHLGLHNFYGISESVNASLQRAPRSRQTTAFCSSLHTPSLISLNGRRLQFSTAGFRSRS